MVMMNPDSPTLQMRPSKAANGGGQFDEVSSIGLRSYQSEGDDSKYSRYKNLNPQKTSILAGRAVLTALLLLCTIHIRSDAHDQLRGNAVVVVPSDATNGSSGSAAKEETTLTYLGYVGSTEDANDNGDDANGNQKKGNFDSDGDGIIDSYTNGASLPNGANRKFDLPPGSNTYTNGASLPSNTYTNGAALPSDDNRKKDKFSVSGSGQLGDDYGNEGSAERPDKGGSAQGFADRPNYGNEGSVDRPDYGGEGQVDRPDYGNQGSVDRPDYGNQGSVDRPDYGNQGNANRPDGSLEQPDWGAGADGSVQRPKPPMGIDTYGGGNDGSVQRPSWGALDSVQRPSIPSWGADGDAEREDYEDMFFAGCLVLNDEHETEYLVEWLAYHYYVMPLRRLIVWRDPLMKSSPDSILERWTEKIGEYSRSMNMTITLWDKPEHIFPIGHPFWHQDNTAKYEMKHDMYETKHLTGRVDDRLFNRPDYKTHSTLHHEQNARNSRQDIFFGACMRKLKREGRSWVLMSHSDEFTLLNPRLRDESDPMHQGATNQKKDCGCDQTTSVGSVVDEDGGLIVPSAHAAGSVMKWIYQIYHSSAAATLNTYIMSQPCLPLSTKPFGTYEDTASTGLEALQNGLEGDLEGEAPEGTYLDSVEKLIGMSEEEDEDHCIKSEDFLTLRWHYWGNPNNSTAITRKHIVNVRDVPPSLLRWKIAGFQPVPNGDICPIHHIPESQNMFIMHHYTGTTERIKYDVNKEKRDKMNCFNCNGIDPNSAGKEDDDFIFVAPILMEEERSHKDNLHNAFHEGGTINQWLDGFVKYVGVERALILLRNVGYMEGEG